MELRGDLIVKTSLVVFLLWLPGVANAGCPDLNGSFAEDDFGIKVHQSSCDRISVKGTYALEPLNHNYENLIPDSVERPCYRDGDYKKFCTTTWVGSELTIMVKVTSGPKQTVSHQRLAIARCDLV